MKILDIIARYLGSTVGFITESLFVDFIGMKFLDYSWEITVTLAAASY